MAKKLTVPGAPLKLTKGEAATRQIEAAIAALVRGHFDIAITLASAAEDMIDRKGSHLFAFLRDHPQVNKKDWIRHINRHRDWFKHASGSDQVAHRAIFRICVDRSCYHENRGIMLDAVHESLPGLVRS